MLLMYMHMLVQAVQLKRKADANATHKHSETYFVK